MTTSSKLHVTQIASGDLWAGAEVQLFTLCKALNKIEDVTVSVILLNYGTLEQKLKEIEIPVVVLDETKLNGIILFWSIFKQLRQQAPDIIHTHRIKENIFGGLAAKLLRLPSIRTVHGAPEHTPGWLKPHKRLLYLLDWFIGQYLQKRVIAVSQDLRTLLTKIYRSENILVIENGVDIGSLLPYQKKTDINTNTASIINLGIIGRLVPVKRVDIFIQIAAFLQHHHPEITANYYIFGDGPLRAELQTISYTLNVNHLIHFEGHCSDIHQRMSSLDALLITSDHEGLPMTLLEAISIGIPVIAHSVGGIANVCQRGKYCWLSDDNSVEKLSDLVIDCFNDQEKRHLISRYAKQYVSDRYSSAENAASYLIVYKNIKMNKEIISKNGV